MFKNLKLFLSMVFVGSAMLASAQFTGGGSKSAFMGDTNPYNRISLSYDNTHWGANDKAEGYFMGEDGMSLNGFGLEYIHGFSLSKKLPMFIETGLKIQFGAGSVSEYDEKEEYEVILKAQQFSFCVPVNYTYKFNIGNKLSIAPYLGLNFRIHAMTRMKYDVKFDDEEEQDWFDEEYEDDLKWFSVYDKDKMGKDGRWNRFQMGWQIGVGLNVKSFYVGLQYGTDFIKEYKYKKQGINSGNLAVKVGYNF